MGPFCLVHLERNREVTEWLDQTLVEHPDITSIKDPMAARIEVSYLDAAVL